MRLLLGIVLGGVLVAGFSVGAAGQDYINSNLAVSPATQANGGGCYPDSIAPDVFGMLTLIDPEWAAVDTGTLLPPASLPVTVNGAVELVHINENGDFPSDHSTDDQNTFIEVDPADTGLVATGNVSPAQGEEAGNMEMEWETGKYPLFAWAGTGDRLTATGRWIWDCGHPNEEPAGTCSTTTTQSCFIDADCAAPACPTCVPGETCQNVTFNYSTEVHPPQAVAVSRIGRAYAFSPLSKGAREPSTRTDVWISPDGGGAGDACVVTHQASPTSLLSLNCFPLSHPLANVNASNFEFDIPLPPRPSRASKLRLKVFDRTPSGLPQPRVTTTFDPGPPPMVHAVVDMTTPIHGVLPSQAGKTIIAGWRGGPNRAARVQVIVTGIEIVNPLKEVTPPIPIEKRCSVTTTQDCSATACPAGETCLTLGGPTPGWQVLLEVNGEWQAIPALDSVSAAGMIPEQLNFDTAMLPGGTLHLHATGRSFACISQLVGQSLARSLSLYGLTDGLTCLIDENKNIGSFDVSFPGPGFGSGGKSMDYVTQSIGGAGGMCSGSAGQLCLTSADCPAGEACNVTGGAFKLHYTIQRVRH